ncbi:MAG TPA: response regulator [Cyanobacteria bacterium UBA11162]|nr:response regulator [Cyanobacteria bacterium UBA11162]
MQPQKKRCRTPAKVTALQTLKAELKPLPKILVIDDDAAFLEVLVDSLNDQNYQVFTAKNGIWGLRFAETMIPDLIICDIRMPGLDGYQVLKALRQNPVTMKIPFVFMTAEDIESDRAKELGADDFFSKCFMQFEDLIKIIQTKIKAK